MKKSFATFLGAALVGLSALVTSSTASAAIVTGNWDPKLPQNFGNYGWTATINVAVDPDCAVGQQALNIVNVLGLSFGCNANVLVPESAFRILSAEVGIYDWTTKVLVDVLRFNPASFGAFVYGELQLGPTGAIRSLQTLLPSNSQRSAITYADGRRYDFRLALPGGDPALEYRRANAGFFDSFTRATEPVTDRLFSVNTTQTEAQVVAATRLEIGQTVFSVPEPGTLGLVGFALAALGLGASRRSRRTDSQAAPA